MIIVMCRNSNLAPGVKGLFLINLEKFGYNAEYLCTHKGLKLVLAVEKQFNNDGKNCITSIFIKSCNVKATFKTILEFKHLDRLCTPTFVNIIDNECMDQPLSIIKSWNVNVTLLEVTVIDCKYNHDENKICKFPCDDLSEDYEALMKNENSSDVTINVGNEKFSCHKLILSTRSPVFARMFESDMLEKQSGQLKIEDVTPETFQLLLNFIYTGRLNNADMNEIKVDWQELVLAAEKYDIDNLKKVCWQNITGTLSVANAIDAFILADRLNQHELKKIIATFILINKKKLVDTAKYEELVKNHKELALELLQIILKS